MSKAIIRIKMINNFLIISCIGKDDKLGLRINKDFFIYNCINQLNSSKDLVLNISKFINKHYVKLDKNFAVIVNQGPGSFSGIRTSLAVAKGLKISKKIKLYGYNDTDLKVFNQENIEKLLEKKLLEINLIKPIYLS